MLSDMTRRLAAPLALLLASALPGAAAAQNPPAFDLVGPSLRATVTRGAETLPLAEVPNLLPGDRLSVAAELPADQSARYILVVVFLRGATNPPPEEWLLRAETWRPKGRTVSAVVPQGAAQVMVFLVPETGGAFKAVRGAVLGRPGAFVRASQELNQARLDRARLDAFLAGLQPRGPADRGRAARVSGQLARSLAVRFDEKCLTRQPEFQAACLSQGAGTTVLADGHSSSVAEALAGAPTDLAYQISATPQGGYGYYSSYIGVVRDLARILGAFQSAQLQFIPALSVERGNSTALLLNTVPSFRRPQSVLVAALPPVQPAQLPPLAPGEAGAALCAAKPGLVLPVEGAPLVFGTRYARQMRLRVPLADGRTAELPVEADAERGGYVPAPDALAGLAVADGTDAVLHGRWGFQPFEGPRYRLVSPAGRRWRVADGQSLVTGRDTPLELRGGAGPCVSGVTAEVGGAAESAGWEVRGADAVQLTVPLADADPGPVTLTVAGWGGAEPQQLIVQAYAEVPRIAGLTVHAGDRDAVLTGARLDQVTGLDLGGIPFRPGALERAGKGDRLPMITDTAGVGVLRAGEMRQARALLADGRSVSFRVTVLPPRPVAPPPAEPAPVPVQAPIPTR